MGDRAPIRSAGAVLAWPSGVGWPAGGPGRFPLLKQGILAVLLGRTAPLRRRRGQGHRFVSGACGLERSDVVGVPKGEGDVVESLHQAPTGVVVDLEGRAEVLGPYGLLGKVHSDLGAGLVLEDLPQQ